MESEQQAAAVRPGPRRGESTLGAEGRGAPSQLSTRVSLYIRNPIPEKWAASESTNRLSWSVTVSLSSNSVCGGDGGYLGQPVGVGEAAQTRLPRLACSGASGGGGRTTRAVTKPTTALPRTGSALKRALSPFAAFS